MSEANTLARFGEYVLEHQRGELFIHVMQYATVALGSIAVLLAAVLSLLFWRSRKPIGKAVALMLTGEAVGALVTVIFAMTTYGLTNIMTEGWAIALRWVMFSAASLSSIHLAYRTWQLEGERDS